MTKPWLQRIAPLSALAAVIIAIIAAPGLLTPDVDSSVPEDLTVERVEITDAGFRVKIRSNSATSMQIAQVVVDGAFWIFTQEPAGPLTRMQSAWITIDFPWVAQEVHHLRFVTTVGATFDHSIDLPSALVDGRRTTLLQYTLVGLLVGFVPVALGMFFYPAIRELSEQGLAFILALTIGMLAYLFVDMTLEGLTLAQQASRAFGGASLVVVPLVMTVIGLLSIRYHATRKRSGFQVALFIALGIGLHNFGEGLAIGASLAVNKVALGAFLIVGFMLHNTTEGIGIVAPLVKERAGVAQFFGLALIAGLPLVPGIWLGVFAFSPHWAAVFFGVGAGAVLQVIIEIDRFRVGDESDVLLRSRVDGASVAGYATGLALMYATALLISI